MSPIDSHLSGSLNSCPLLSSDSRVLPYFQRELPLLDNRDFFSTHEDTPLIAHNIENTPPVQNITRKREQRSDKDDAHVEDFTNRELKKPRPLYFDGSTPKTISPTVSSSSSCSGSSTTQTFVINTDLKDQFLALYNPIKDQFPCNFSPMTSIEKFIKEFLKEKTTYTKAKANFSAVCEYDCSKELKKVILKEIYLKASITLYMTQAAPAAFLYTGPEKRSFNFIAYENKSGLEGRISLFKWSGTTVVSRVPKAVYLGCGAFSIAQSVKELASNEEFALKSIFSGIKTRYLDLGLSGISRENALLHEIHEKNNHLQGIQRPPILTIPKQIIPKEKIRSANPEVLIGGHIEEKYDGSLEELNFNNLSHNQKLSFIRGFKDIVEAVQFLNSHSSLSRENYIHGDIKPGNILYKTNINGNLSLCLCDFGFSYSHETVLEWYSSLLEKMEYPLLYTTNFYQNFDKISIKVDLVLNNREEALKKIKAMEIYALGQTLKCVFNVENTHYTDPRPLYVKSIEHKLNPEFYINIFDLISSMTEPNPSDRPNFEEVIKFLDDLINLNPPVLLSDSSDYSTCSESSASSTCYERSESIIFNSSSESATSSD